MLASAAFLATVLAGCAYSQGAVDETPQPCNAAGQTITYSGTISPIFDANCRGCHSSKDASTLGGSIDFSTHQGISRFPSSTLLGSIRHSPGANPMPKLGSKLSDCDINRIKAWIDAGKPNN
ncbi:MAG TPA: c-type cytochrome [Hymenobacter sp.]